MASTAAAPPEVLAKPAARLLSEALGDRLLGITDFRGDLAITVKREAWVEAARLLRDHPELDYKLFLDLCGVDYLDRDDRPERFEVVLHLYSVSKKHHVRLQDPGARGASRSSRPSPPSSRAPTGSSARRGTSTGSSSRATRTSSAS